MAGNVIGMTQTTQDRRQRPPYPLTAQPDDKVVLVDRERAAELAGVSVRTITRWARLGYLTKFTNGSGGRVQFSEYQCRAMLEFEPGGSV